jgi:hypothetical protein
LRSTRLKHLEEVLGFLGGGAAGLRLGDPGCTIGGPPLGEGLTGAWSCTIGEGDAAGGGLGSGGGG